MYHGPFGRRVQNDKPTYVYSDANKVFSGYRGDGWIYSGALISIDWTGSRHAYGVLIGVMAGIANLIPYDGTDSRIRTYYRVRCDFRD